MNAGSVLSGVVPMRDFLRAYPFYFAWDESDVIVETGPSLAKVCPEAIRGRRLQDIFHAQRPTGEFSSALARANADQLFLLEARASRRILRGSLLFVEEAGLAVMLATPWIADPAQLDDFGLTLDDFGPQDQTLELLHLLQAQHVAAADLRRLNQTLVEKRELLRQQEEQSRKLALVASRTDNAVIVTDAESRIEWVNEGFTRMTGWRLDETRGRKPSEFLHGPETDPAVVRYMSDCVRKGSGFEAELVNYRRDGAAYWLALEVQPLLDEAGRVTNFMAIERDVTGRKAAEEALRRSEADVRRQRDELEWIYQNAPIGLCFLDRDMRYRRVNRWLAEMNGVSVHAHIGRTVAEVVPAMARKVEPLMRGILATGEPVRIENVLGETPSSPGVVRYFNENWYPVFDDRGGIAGVGLVVEEITERKRAQALSEADRRKDEFLATLAHELRNPLVPIMNAIHTLQMPASLDPAFQVDNMALLAMADRQVKYLVRLVNDLLEVARISLGKIELRKERIDLGALLPEAIALSQPEIEAKRHRLRVDLPPEPLVLEGDPVRLTQVFANLVNNAAKYTGAEGQIRLVATREGDEAVVAVRDDGIGVPPDMLDSIFELFTQVDYAADKSKGGVGIGLALAQRLARLHGGGIEARSDGVGRGAEFVVRLPLLRQSR